MDIFELLWAYVLVFLLAAVPFFEVLSVIPIATVVGLHLFPVTIIAFLGNTVTVLAVIGFVDQIRNWIQKGNKKEDNSSKRSQRAKNMWEKYGLPGLTLIGPLLIGSHLAAFMGLSFGASKAKTTMWMVISLAVWSLAAAVLTFYGIDFFQVDTGEDSFLGKFLQFSE